jgi:putative transposase/transposase-like zinc-binding protein
MVEIADIFRLHGPEYRSQFRDRMPPSHLRAMDDIEHCRTEALGGQLYLCDQCKEQHYSYHSCKNRHCPKCQNDQANEWLENQKCLLLPVSYFMVTFTLPEELRSSARSHQKLIYNSLFRASSEALLELASDPRFVGAKIGAVGVLHTWTRDLFYPPHVHYIVTGGGLSADGRWLQSRQDFLVHVKPLSILFRAKFRDLLKQSDLFQFLDQQVWSKAWVVHSQPVGSGQAAFKYLAPYIFRVAISNRRILALEDSQVTFSYKDSATDQTRFSTISAEEFIRRFLQHVLPKGFVKVRYYGLLSTANRHLLDQARQLLNTVAVQSNSSNADRQQKDPIASPHCPKCGTILRLLERLKPKTRWPP